MMRLKISENRRFLATENDEPFFYLADTAWELFHRLTREEADFYLETRAAQGYNVVQAVALAEFDGLRVPNAYGDLPLHDLDPTRPNEKYFEFVDYVIDKAQTLGIFVALLPCWGDKWNLAWGEQFGGLQVFTPENAAIYADWLARRYADKEIIWVLGGDRPIENETHRAIIDAMAASIVRVESSTRNRAHLRTFHPPGRHSSSEFVHDAAWLDFNMQQTGHTSYDLKSYETIAHDYVLEPTKPVLDGEPRYENHPMMGDNWQWNGVDWFEARDVRIAAYHAIFAGACGHTYGCHDVWQMWDETRTVVNNVRTPWKEALFLEGATQMQHAKKLMESRAYFSRIPDQTLLLSQQSEGRNFISATRDENGSFALVYIPSGQNVRIDGSKLSGETLVASWFSPRDGNSEVFAKIANSSHLDFTPPDSNDWVLILDDADFEYSK